MAEEEEEIPELTEEMQLIGGVDRIVGLADHYEIVEAE